MIASETQGHATVPVEATAFFGAATVFILVLFVLFIYINQKWCLISLGGFPFSCCDEPVIKTTRSKDLGNPLSFESQEGGSDSDEDILRRLRESVVLHSLPEPVPGPSHYSEKPHKIHKTNYSSQNLNGQDLISLAEKGKVGTGSCPSSSCSTTSGEDEPHKEKALRHRDSRGSGGSNNCRKLAMQVSIDTMNEEITSYHSKVNTVNTVVNPSINAIQQETINISNQDDNIFDVTDLQSEFGDHESTLISKCGSLEVAFAYDAPMRKMTVHVLQARDIPSKDRGGATHTQVRLLMLPSKKQKHKSKIRSGENPQFMESFLLHRVNPEDVNSMGVRFRLYGCERMRRERMIGECVVSFAALNLELETNMWLALEPRANIALNSSASDLLSLARSDSTGSTHSMQHGGVPELLLGLAYNGTTGRLSVEVVKGSHFSLCGTYRNLTMPRAPDTYVKLCLVSSTGQEMARCKTSIRRGQPNPLFKEMFMFQVALFQLPDVTLMVSVYTKRSMKRKEMVGWFSLGLNSSGEEELAHWNDMRDVKGEQICRWHILVDS